MTRKFPRPSRRTVVIILILATFFAALRQIPGLGPAKMLVVSAFAPVQARLFSLGAKASSFLADLSQRRDLAKENQALKERISQLESVLAGEYDRRLAREEELQSLKVFLREHEDETIEGIPAHVVGCDSANWRSSIVIDRGSADGVEEHQPVVWNNHVVGVVAEAGEATSRVKLVTDPECRIMGRSARSREKCIVEGTADGKCHLKHVFDSVDIRKDDIIVTTGEDGIFPRHVLIGTVVSCDPSEVGLFQQVVVAPRMAPSQIETVLVIQRISARTKAKKG